MLFVAVNWRSSGELMSISRNRMPTMKCTSLQIELSNHGLRPMKCTRKLPKHWNWLLKRLSHPPWLLKRRWIAVKKNLTLHDSFPCTEPIFWFACSLCLRAISQADSTCFIYACTALFRRGRRSLDRQNAQTRTNAGLHNLAIHFLLRVNAWLPH